MNNKEGLKCIHVVAIDIVKCVLVSLGQIRSLVLNCVMGWRVAL